MSVLLIVGALALAAVAFGAIRMFLYSSGPSDRVIVQPGPTTGKVEKNSALVLPRSFNQPEGIVFSFTGWILVRDFTTNYGKKRLIFGKGDCPGVYLDTTSNSLLIVVNTYGSTESILISNIPAQKWIHLAIVVNQYSVDVYVNGILRQHHTLGQLPKQNESTVSMGSSTEGWDGVLSDLTYYQRSLSPAEVESMAANVPKDDMYRAPAGPQYFDMSWYTGRGV
jgi:hypothetical protein